MRRRTLLKQTQKIPRLDGYRYVDFLLTGNAQNMVIAVQDEDVFDTLDGKVYIMYYPYGGQCGTYGSYSTATGGEIAKGYDGANKYYGGNWRLPNTGQLSAFLSQVPCVVETPTVDLSNRSVTDKWGKFYKTVDGELIRFYVNAGYPTNYRDNRYVEFYTRNKYSKTNAYYYGSPNIKNYSNGANITFSSGNASASSSSSNQFKLLGTQIKPS